MTSDRKSSNYGYCPLVTNPDTAGDDKSPIECRSCDPRLIRRLARQFEPGGFSDRPALWASAPQAKEASNLLAAAQIVMGVFLAARRKEITSLEVLFRKELIVTETHLQLSKTDAIGTFEKAEATNECELDGHSNLENDLDDESDADAWRLDIPYAPSR